MNSEIFLRSIAYIYVNDNISLCDLLKKYGYDIDFNNKSLFLMSVVDMFFYNKEFQKEMILLLKKHNQTSIKVDLEELINKDTFYQSNLEKINQYIDMYESNLKTNRVLTASIIIIVIYLLIRKL